MRGLLSPWTRGGRRRWLGGALIALAAAAVLLALAPRARAADDPAALFAEGVEALQGGRAGDAIDALEACADRGVVDAAASFDRGLAYATRVRIGAGAPGDLGEAAHGFEEARDLARDPRLATDAARALAAVRGEIARRRLRAGQPIEVDPGRSLARALAGLLAEGAWAAVAMAASLALGAGLFVRWLAARPRARATGAVVAGVAAPALAFAAAMTLAARHDRLYLVEAVVVGADARPTDERGLAVPGAAALPEGARVEVVGTSGGGARVRFGARDVWVAGGEVRTLAK